MNKIWYKKIKLSTKQAKSYAEMSGFPNTGDVTLYLTNALDELYKPKK